MTESKAESCARDISRHTIDHRLSLAQSEALRTILGLNALRREIILDLRQRLEQAGVKSEIRMEHEGRLLKILEE